MPSGIPLAGDPDPLPIPRPRLDPHFKRFDPLDRPLTMARRTVEMFFPVPWHRGHCTLNFIRPPVCSMVPLPWHCGQVPGASTNPDPWHVPQVSRRAMFRLHHAPRIAVQNGTLTWYSRSEPGSGASCAAAPPRSNMLEKMSRNPPPPPAEELFFPRPPPSNRSEKSNPPKSKWTPPAPAEPGPEGCPPGYPPGNLPAFHLARA